MQKEAEYMNENRKTGEDWKFKVDFHIQKIFRGQERKGTEKLMGMRMRHVNRKIFCSILFRGKLNRFQLFLSFPYGIDFV